jgi:hypothetical protein
MELVVEKSLDKVENQLVNRMIGNNRLTNLFNTIGGILFVFDEILDRKNDIEYELQIEFHDDLIDDYLKGNKLDEQLYVAQYIDSLTSDDVPFELTKKEKIQIDKLMTDFINLYYKPPKKVQRLLKAIEDNKFNLNRNKFSYYGLKGTIEPLNCSYGAIGYTIYIEELKAYLYLDFDLGKINYTEYR